MNDYRAWFDGACGPVNPGGTAASGSIIKGIDGAVLLEEGRLVGTGPGMSNNVAEYAAVTRVLQYLLPRSPGHVTIHGDSQLAIKQLKGEWGIHDGLYYSAAMEAQDLLARLRSLGWQVELRWIPRTQNEECDALSKAPLADAGVPREIQQYAA